MLWFNKRELKDDETCLDKIKRIESRITRMEAEILDVATAQDIIRNKVLRKIQYKQDEKEEVKEDKYKGILLPDTTNSFGGKI